MWRHKPERNETETRNSLANLPKVYKRLIDSYNVHNFLYCPPDCQRNKYDISNSADSPLVRRPRLQLPASCRTISLTADGRFASNSRCDFRWWQPHAWCNRNRAYRFSRRTLHGSSRAPKAYIPVWAKHLLQKNARKHRFRRFPIWNNTTILTR
jgi:hypothetical protein